MCISAGDLQQHECVDIKCRVICIWSLFQKWQRKWFRLMENGNLLYFDTDKVVGLLTYIFYVTVYVRILLIPLKKREEGF